MLSECDDGLTNILANFESLLFWMQTGTHVVKKTREVFSYVVMFCSCMSNCTILKHLPYQSQESTTCFNMVWSTHTKSNMLSHGTDDVA